MAITALGYIGVRSGELDSWSDFTTKQLGMQQVDRAGQALTLRMDDHKQRLIISAEPGDTLAFLGWEVESSEDLDGFAARLSDQGVAVTQANRSLCDRRFVSSMVKFDDPEGNRIELFYGPMTSDQPFVPGRAISGFKTAAFGMGHAVLHSENATSLLPFYSDLLGFKVSDFGMAPYPMYFFHVNGRHHSFALIGSGQSGFHHFMVEYHNLDDVGQGYDLAQLENDLVAYTLGRHTNDFMTSFYAKTPSGFFIESGWGGRIIDPENWEAVETFCGPSFWGHERLHLPEDKRKTLRDMRLQTAADGQRTPHLVNCPWLYQNNNG